MKKSVGNVISPFVFVTVRWVERRLWKADRDQKWGYTLDITRRNIGQTRAQDNTEKVISPYIGGNKKYTATFYYDNVPLLFLIREPPSFEIETVSYIFVSLLQPLLGRRQ